MTQKKYKITIVPREYDPLTIYGLDYDFSDGVLSVLTSRDPVKRLHYPLGALAEISADVVSTQIKGE
jgi:hypothetical protein